MPDAAPPPEIARELPRAFAFGCLGVPVLLLGVAVALRWRGVIIPADSGDTLLPELSPILFALGCTYFAARPRKLVIGNRAGGHTVPAGFLEIVRYVILGCGAVVPAVVAMTTASYWPLAAALVPIAAMVAWFPKKRTG